MNKYTQSEELARKANHFTYGDGADPTTGMALATEAQVYATLALVDELTSLRAHFDQRIVIDSAKVTRAVQS